MKQASTLSENWAGQEGQLLRENIRMLRRYDEPAKAVREILHLLSELIGLSRGRVVLPYPEHGDLAIRYAYGSPAKDWRAGAMHQTRASSAVLHKGEKIIVQNIDQDAAFLARAVGQIFKIGRLIDEPTAPLRMEDQSLKAALQRRPGLQPDSAGPPSAGHGASLSSSAIIDYPFNTKRRVPCNAPTSQK